MAAVRRLPRGPSARQLRLGLLAGMAALVLGAGAGSAAADSAPASGVPTPPPTAPAAPAATTPTPPVPAPTTPTKSVPAATTPTATTPAPTAPAATTLPLPTVAAPAGSPLSGQGMWIWYVSASSGGNLGSIVSTALRHGVSTLFVKAGDGAGYWSQFSPSLVSALHARGLRACAWQYVYGSQPVAEAAVGARAVRSGADCLVIDAESEYEGKYLAAQTYLTHLRALIGADYPVALASFPYVDYHPAFPYSVFLGPGGAQFNAPQMYWRDIGTTVDQVYAHTFAYNLLYGRPISPLGQTYNHPSAAAIAHFRQLAGAFGASGVSWWDWQESGAAQWRALSRPLGALAAASAVWQPPALSPGARGDLVVWAQEHLLSSGYPVRVSGVFGAGLAQALAAFQTANGLPVDGIIDAPTWQALLRYAPAAVVWTRRGAHPVPARDRVHAARAARMVLEQAPPLSAALPARRDEIPAGLGSH